MRRQASKRAAKNSRYFQLELQKPKKRGEEEEK
jgi:hypothetical protein